MTALRAAISLPSATARVLDVRALSVELATFAGALRVLDRIEFMLDQGQVLGVVGVSGSGKSVLVNALVNAVRPPARIIEGSVVFQGEDLITKPTRALLGIRGRRIGVVAANPRGALHPMHRIGDQLTRVYRAHVRASQREATERAAWMLERLGISDPERRLSNYPHELSGGMAKRVLIAMALICDPELLIADEPGGGLDVTVQAQILEHFRSLIDDEGMSAIVITRDLGVVAHYCDEVCVLQAGRIVERSPYRQFFERPRHPHSLELLNAFREIAGATAPDDRPPPAPAGPTPLLQVRDLRREFQIKGSSAPLVAVDDVSFELFGGETVALVGESGSGKTTIGRCLLRLIEPTAGRVIFNGHDLIALDAEALRPLRPQMQIVFQDPYNSLNPRRTVLASLTEPLRLWTDLDRPARAERARELARLVGLDPDRHLASYPHQLTSGEQQRVAIARAVALSPKLIVLDEVTSALDPNARAAMIKLLQQLQRQAGFAYLFISHDLSVVRQISSRVLVMYLGRLVESGPTEELFRQPRHPYTRALLGSVLWPDPAQRRQLSILSGEIPSPVNLPQGCYFASRCPLQEAVCLTRHPPMHNLAPDHAAACFVASRHNEPQ